MLRAQEGSWEPVERDRKGIFEKIRSIGHPDVMALLARLGEDAIANPEALLAWGSVDDPTFERPPQPPAVEQRRGPLCPQRGATP